MAAINYAESYARELAQAYPNVLNFGALYATENNGRYRMLDLPEDTAKTLRTAIKAQYA